MEILRYEPEMAARVAASYNQGVRGVPHCHPVRPARFAASLAAACGEGEGHKELRSEAAFVAREGRSLLGFVHVAMERARKDRPEKRGMIRFLWYRRGHRAAGESLRTTAEKYVRARGAGRIVAFPRHFRYPFYHFTNAFLSEHLDHVQAVLSFSGYRRVNGEVFLDWPDFEPASPTRPGMEMEVRVEERAGRGRRPGVRVSAHREGKQLGECVCVSAAEWHEYKEAHDWIFTNWLGVERWVQGQGVGRYLLQRALREAHRLGYRHAAISTGWKNHRAYGFYSNHGYHMVDWTYQMERPLR